MDGIKCQDDLGTVKLCPLLRYVIVAHQVDEVSAWHVVHCHVQVLSVLKCVVQLHMRTAHSGQNVIHVHQSKKCFYNINKYHLAPVLKCNEL